MSSSNSSVNTKLDFDKSDPKPASVYLGSLKEFFKETAPNATVEQKNRLNNLLLSMIQMNLDVFKNQREATFRKVENMKVAVKKMKEKTEEIKKEILQGPTE
ncbi:Protein CBG27812 [Caenorhabditis briggsae]|nr:Protein CBG27812 [Caenorhabditis briggsae]ULT83141.1 hypothetical protein L3Y34_012411 [Caenorhabditis briggsae]CAS00324.1 Protein CBG27812 [Caenorhabditis briggsae]